MATINDIGWGKYQSYSGPFFLGVRRFKLPAKPTENEMLLAVMTRTEGGRADAVNGYDRCIISCGYIQFCEATYFLTSNLLGAIADRDPGLLDPLQPALAASGASFKKTPRGRWRFHFDVRGEVDTGMEQKQLFLLHSSGHQGDWDDDSVAHAKLWAASVSNTLNQDGADAVQMEYVASRMKGFATASARKVLFDGTPSTGWTGATRAIYLSFAGNLPAVASKQLAAALDDMGTKVPKWTKDWCIHITRRLTFGPNIAIYPHRYNAIRPVVEQLYGVDLPDMAEELKVWQKNMEMEPVEPEVIYDENLEEPTFTTTREVQQLLSDLGYDLGPAGVDGWMGRKTRDAIITFQSLNGLVADGLIGPRTRAKMVEVWRART
jgi:hypothetical protein